jgi:hypothetical protein
MSLNHDFNKRGMICAIHGHPIIATIKGTYYPPKGISNPGAKFLCKDCLSREAPIRAKTKRGNKP